MKTEDLFNFLKSDQTYYVVNHKKLAQLEMLTAEITPEIKTYSGRETIKAKAKRQCLNLQLLLAAGVTIEYATKGKGATIENIYEHISRMYSPAIKSIERLIIVAVACGYLIPEPEQEPNHE